VELLLQLGELLVGEVGPAGVVHQHHGRAVSAAASAATGTTAADRLRTGHGNRRLVQHVLQLLLLLLSTADAGRVRRRHLHALVVTGRRHHGLSAAERHRRRVGRLHLVLMVMMMVFGFYHCNIS